MSSISTFFNKHSSKIYFLIFSTLSMLVIWYATKTVNMFLFGFPLVVIFVYFSLNNYKALWYLMVFLMPLSISDPKFFGKFAGVTFPTDFLAIMLLGLLIFKLASERTNINKILSHPITIVLGVQILWMIFAAIPSEMPIVSWKYLAAWLWLVAAFFMVPVLLFHEKSAVFRYFQLICLGFGIAFAIVLFFYVSTGRSLFGLRFNPTPFFVDHTVFGAFTAMWVPVLVLLSFTGKLTDRERWFARLMLVAFTMALFFSYSRGAWASAVGSVIMMGIFLMRKWARRILLPTMFILIGISGYLWYAGQGNIRSKTMLYPEKASPNTSPR